MTQTLIDISKIKDHNVADAVDASAAILATVQGGAIGTGTVAVSNVTGALRVTGGVGVNGTTYSYTNNAGTSNDFYGGFVTAGSQTIASSGFYRAVVVAPHYSATSGTLNQLQGILTAPNNQSTGDITSLYGIVTSPENSSSGTVPGEIAGVYCIPSSNGSGLVHQLFGVQSQPQLLSTGNVDTMIAFYSDLWASGSGTVTNGYGLYLDFEAGHVARFTNIYSIVSPHPTAPMVHYGPLQLGQPSTTAGQVRIYGGTSGSVNIITALVAGTSTATFPATTGNVAVTGSLAHTQSTVAAPTGTTNTTGDGVMMGLAGTITPVLSGTVHIVVQGTITNTAANDGAVIHLRTGTGAAPSNAGALTGTTRGSAQTYTPAVNAYQVPFSVAYTVTGLTLNTAYWIDVSLAARTGGTATLTAVDIIADEIP